MLPSECYEVRPMVIHEAYARGAARGHHAHRLDPRDRARRPDRPAWFRPRDPDALAAGLAALASDPARASTWDAPGALSPSASWGPTTTGRRSPPLTPVPSRNGGGGGVKIAMIGQKGIPATYGGIERHVEEIARRLVARGHEVTVYCRFHYTPTPGRATMA